MCEKLIMLVFVILAVVMGVLVNVLPASYMPTIISIAKFFQVMLPVLAVGALLKYMCPKSTCSKCGCSTNNS